MNRPLVEKALALNAELLETIKHAIAAGELYNDHYCATHLLLASDILKDGLEILADHEANLHEAVRLSNKADTLFRYMDGVASWIRLFMGPRQ